MSQAANAVSGKTARACDGCVRRRARWYCAADDAFLCQSCDASVHSANPLASRHDRVRLKTASSSTSSSPSSLSRLSELDSNLPTWHRGPKQKARTPRHGKTSVAKTMLLVPDMETLNEYEEGEEQLLYQVPVFDPILEEFCTPSNYEEISQSTEMVKPSQVTLAENSNQNYGTGGFDPTDIELAEFAADVENLLGQGLDDIDSFCLDGLGLLEVKEDQSQVKHEFMDELHDKDMKFIVDMGMEISKEPLDFKFDATENEEAEEQKMEVDEKQNASMGIGLMIDYNSVINAWSCQGGSPWTDGVRPQFSVDDCWANIMGTWGTPMGEMLGTSCGFGIGQVGRFDGGREARVSRYREKRRTRLFSKKIRYEVRKLNAEKRPRMKGRFVKRTSIPVAANVTAGSNGFPYV